MRIGWAQRCTASVPALVERLQVKVGPLNSPPGSMGSTFSRE
jgi:hypothetical protein